MHNFIALLCSVTDPLNKAEWGGRRPVLDETGTKQGRCGGADSRLVSQSIDVARWQHPVPDRQLGAVRLSPAAPAD